MNEVSKVVTIEVNNKPVRAESGEILLDVLRRNGVRVPTLCHQPGLTPTGACRLCVVEVEGMKNLVPSCAFPINDEMKVKTHSPRALKARKTIVELLLADHPDDCLYCVRNGQCDLQDIAAELGVRERRFQGCSEHVDLDMSSPAVIRDPAKCILCGRCVRVCEEVQGVGAIDFIGRGSKTKVSTAFDQGFNVSSCIYCGQCIMVCPTGALRERSQLKEVTEALNDPDRVVVVQHAPAVSVTLAEEFNTKPGIDICGVMTAALRKIGFDRVFDTSFAADLTIMEEGSELVHRIQNGGVLPMLTSCSPGWIKYVEQFFPQFMGNLSTCKSPQQMMGAVIKTHFANKQDLDPKQIYSVSIMPCTAKKFEVTRPEMARNGLPDVDAVLTTRELARLIHMRGIDLQALEPEAADSPLGERTTAGKLFGVTGGVMEAAVRSAHYLLTGTELEKFQLEDLRGLKGVKEARLQIADQEIGVAVASGLGNASKLLEQLQEGRDDLHFIEIMTCPGGCIAGGGQPVRADLGVVRARMRALYGIDEDEAVRVSHANQSVQKLYDDFLGKPLGPKSHELLHTHYSERALKA